MERSGVGRARSHHQPRSRRHLHGRRAHRAARVPRRHRLAQAAPGAGRALLRGHRSRADAARADWRDAQRPSGRSRSLARHARPQGERGARDVDLSVRFRRQPTDPTAAQSRDQLARAFCGARPHAHAVCCRELMVSGKRSDNHVHHPRALGDQAPRALPAKQGSRSLRSVACARTWDRGPTQARRLLCTLHARRWARRHPRPARGQSSRQAQLCTQEGRR